MQKFLFVTLDIFRKNQHNKIINTKLDAWLLFLSSDDPEDILRLISEYPEFRAMYEQAYAMCRNLEDIMGFFSEELRMLDRNTVQYMIDEMQAQLDEKKVQLDEKQSQLDEKQSQLDAKNLLIEEQQQQLEDLQRYIAELERK